MRSCLAAMAPRGSNSNSLFTCPATDSETLMRFKDQLTRREMASAPAHGVARDPVIHANASDFPYPLRRVAGSSGLVQANFADGLILVDGRCSILPMRMCALPRQPSKAVLRLRLNSVESIRDKQKFRA